MQPVVDAKQDLRRAMRGVRSGIADRPSRTDRLWAEVLDRCTVRARQTASLTVLAEMMSEARIEPIICHSSRLPLACAISRCSAVSRLA